MWLSRDGGLSWYDPGAGRPKPTFSEGNTRAWIAGIHGQPVELSDGRLLALGRGDPIGGMMPKSISADGGTNWTYSASVLQPIGGGKRCTLRKLQEGPLFFAGFATGLTVTDASGGTRLVSGLYAALSYDNGVTWPYMRLVSDDGPGRTVETTDGATFTLSISNAEPGGFRSTDRSASWERRNPYVDTQMYYGRIWCDPADVDRIYVAGTIMQVSDDGGKTVQPFVRGRVHVDFHALWIDPSDPQYYLLGTDGGVYESFDRGGAWQWKSNLPTVQFYRVTVDNPRTVLLCLRRHAGQRAHRRPLTHHQQRRDPEQRLVPDHRRGRVRDAGRSGKTEHRVFAVSVRRARPLRPLDGRGALDPADRGQGSCINEIRKGLPSPLYLFYASDPFLHREALAAIRELVPVAERDFNLHEFDLLAQGEENLTLERILDVVNTVSFFGGRRFTLLMGNLQKFPKKDIEKLQAYATKPAQDSVFVILHYGEMKKEAREKFKVFKPVSIDIRESEIPQWIKQRVRTKGIDFSDEAVDYLISLVGNDLGLLWAEIEKISFVGQKRIDVDDISDIVAGGRQYGIFDLVNALKAQDADNVFRIYKSLKETSDDYGLIGALNWQYARFSHEKMSRQEQEYLLKVFELLNQADIEIKSSGRSFPMEYLLIKLLRLQGLHSPSV